MYANILQKAAPKLRIKKSWNSKSDFFDTGPLKYWVKTYDNPHNYFIFKNILEIMACD
jgi:hypothetical protein